MLARQEWEPLARELDWDVSYVDPAALFPPEVAGQAPVSRDAWRAWEEPYRTTYVDYVTAQTAKEAEVAALRAALGRPGELERLPRAWRSALKLHLAAFTLPEFAAVVANLRAARFGRTAPWRQTAVFGALDELRHAQVQLQLGADLVRVDPQFDWTHRLLHTDNWVAIAVRHLIDELILAADPLEFAIGTHIVFETGFTNLEFVALAASAYAVGDHLFERVVTSIQSDEARHAQVGSAVAKILTAHDRPRVQYLLDKWFWRTWQVFSVVSGFGIDYLTPMSHRTTSFRECVGEWIEQQYLAMLHELGVERPWYWPELEQALAYGHHMVYASAYTYRASVWFDLVVPGPAERAWLAAKYPDSWPELAPVWERIDHAWRAADPGNDLAVHGTSIIGFCDVCQLVLSGGTPRHNAATVLDRDGRRYIFCSGPCRWIFESEPERYGRHKSVVPRVLAGEAPANLLALLKHFGLSWEMWGKDSEGGAYPWLARAPR